MLQLARCLSSNDLDIFVKAFKDAEIDGTMLMQVSVSSFRALCSSTFHCSIVFYPWQAEPEDVADLVDGAPPQLKQRLEVFVTAAQSDGVVVPEAFDGHPARDSTNPQVFMDIEISHGASKNKVKRRMVFELFADVVPKTAKNFRVLCKGNTRSKRGTQLAFANSKLHRIIPGV